MNAVKHGKSRVVLALKPHTAPIKAAVIPITKNDSTIVDCSKKIKDSLQQIGLGRVVLENTGNIGKSYRKHDAIGTPICITIDFDTLEDRTVTVRDRDTMEQKRVQVESLEDLLKSLLVK
jgi:Glycyl-tRNA synthetase (class II)